MTHHADPGPAAWREYTGDPSPFYREGVGPVFDHGVYRLHLLTSLLGPVSQVQAMGTIATSTRIVRGGPLTGQTIPVTTPDHVLINLAFRDGALGQVLASFGTPATHGPLARDPLPDGHAQLQRAVLRAATLPSASTSTMTLRRRRRAGTDAEPPDDDGSVVEAGVRHFIAVLRGEERPS